MGEWGWRMDGTKEGMEEKKDTREENQIIIIIICSWGYLSLSQ